MQKKIGDDVQKKVYSWCTLVKLKYMLCYSGAKPPAPPGATAVPPGETTLPLGSTTVPSGTTTMPQGSTVLPSGSPPTPAGGGGGGGTEGERQFCQSSLNV